MSCQEAVNLIKDIIVNVTLSNFNATKAREIKQSINDWLNSGLLQDDTAENLKNMVTFKYNRYLKYRKSCLKTPRSIQ